MNSLGASPEGDRAAGLRPQPATQSSLSSIPCAADFVPLPETMPELTIGLLGVKVPPEWGMSLDTAQWNFIRDMRLEEIERRILAIEEMLWPLGR